MYLMTSFNNVRRQHILYIIYNALLKCYVCILKWHLHHAIILFMFAKGCGKTHLQQHKSFWHLSNSNMTLFFNVNTIKRFVPNILIKPE